MKTKKYGQRAARIKQESANKGTPVPAAHIFMYHKRKGNLRRVACAPGLVANYQKRGFITLP